VNDVVVVGTGAFGLSVGLELIRRGRSVQFVSAEAPGRGGASAAETRVARLAHGRDESLTQSAIDGLAAWRELEQICGASLFRPTGVVHLLPLGGDTGWERDSAVTLAALGARTRELDGVELRRLCPALATDELAGGLLECDGGVLLARAATVALHRLVENEGARTVIGAARPTDRGVEVEGDLVEAATVVWAVGAALPDLFPEIPGVEARTHDSHVLAFCEPSLRIMPAWLDRSAPAYGVPRSGSELTFALDLDRSPAEPPQTAPSEGARRYLEARFPRAGLRVVRHEACSYTMTRDEDFVVGLVPGTSRHWVVGGDSGHGFKHALTWGRHAAGAIQGESEPSPRFGLARLHEAPVSGT
jgi:sarcosine oxidase